MGKLNYQQGQFLNARAFMQRYEAAAADTEESLLAAYRIETELGDTRAASEYRRKLIQQFPDSDAAKTLVRQQDSQ